VPLRLDFGNVAMIFLFVFYFMSRSPSLFKWRITVEHFSYFHDENMIHLKRKGQRWTYIRSDVLIVVQ